MELQAQLRALGVSEYSSEQDIRTLNGYLEQPSVEIACQGVDLKTIRQIMMDIGTCMCELPYTVVTNFELFTYCRSIVSMPPTVSGYRGPWQTVPPPHASSVRCIQPRSGVLSRWNTNIIMSVLYVRHYLCRYGLYWWTAAHEYG